MFSFEGRTSRLGFLCYWALGLAAAIVIGLAGGFAWNGDPHKEAFGQIAFLVAIMVYVVILAPAAVRRLRDMGWGTAWAVLFFAPAVGSVMFLLLALVPSRPRWT
jgi:uncharacterized membrane protein YhaH (DUF805 family)